MRAADVPEYVQDGVVDCGITGIDLVRERGADVHELLPLGFGSCRLEAAVPEESPVESLEELAGATVATVYPRLARELLPVDVDARRRDRLGRDRAAARARRRDRRPRLVGQHAAHERAALARRAARVGGGARRPRRRGRRAVRGDAARGRRGAPPPLRDAERARVGAAGDLRARRPARAERAAARRAGHGRRARARARRPRSGGCCPRSRRPAARRS